MTLTSPERLEAAAIAARRDWYDAVPGAFGAVVGEVAGATVFSVRSQPTSSYLNQVVVTGGDVDVEAALARIGHARDPLVHVPDWTGRVDVPGFRAAEDLVRMTMRLDDLPPVPPLPAGMRLEVVTDPARADQLGAVAAEGVTPVPQTVTVGRRGWIWVAVLGPEGTPIGAGLSYVAEEVAVCANAGVVPDQRRQGLHTAMLVARLRAAAAAGATVMTSLATTESPSHLSQAKLGATVACRVTHHRR
ncbi:MAG: hypothetical protein ACRDTP_04495 [Mycobacteriales bacterium]